MTDSKSLHGPEYVARFEANQQIQRVARLLDRIPLRGDEIVVDFGCGNGLLMRLLAGKVSRYAGVDFSEAFIAAARKHRDLAGIANAEVHCASFSDFCAAHRQRFDIAFALDLSEHVPDGEWLAALRAFRDALKPGGRFYLHTPNADFFFERMKARNFIVRQLPEHVAVRNAEANVAFLEQAGFVVTAVERLPHYNILKLLHPLSRLPVAGRWFEARLFIHARAPV